MTNPSKLVNSTVGAHMVAFYLRPPLRALVVIPGNSFEYRDGVSPPKWPNVRVFTQAGAGLGRAGPHDLVLALAHLYVSKSPTGCLRPSARPEESFAKLTKRV